MVTDWNLDELRKKINEIDQSLVTLFEERMEVVSKVSEYKRKHEIPVLDAHREKDVINRTVSLLKNKKLETYLQYFMDDLMTLCRQYQIEQMKQENTFVYEEKETEIKPDSVIGHYGALGSYSEEALLEYFGEDYPRKAYPAFDDVVSALLNKEIDKGVLPVENSSTGTITAVIDLIRDNKIYITGEHITPIRHNLLVVPGTKLSEIKTVYSHHQGLEQSSQFLKQYPWEQIVYKSTANSAELVCNLGDKTKAAIASARCAKTYNLEILAKDIQYNQNNYTRFIMVGRELVVNRNSNKMSIVMDIAHKPGALYNVLRLFNEQNINIMKIESRPIIEKPWEYLFFFDFYGNLMEERVKNLLQCLKNVSHTFRLLGNYRHSERSVI